MIRSSIAGPVAICAALLLAAPASGASAKSCGSAGTTATGLGAVNVKAIGVRCSTALSVARTAYPSSSWRPLVGGRRWSCRTTTASTGSDGPIPRSKVTCRRPSGAAVRFELQS
ncbi:MAG: hypothetical protein JWM31_706 [Solirubrobacterales bacterium]|nr:hypothetical protein [Solirubrobacterales bacterium]